MSRISPAGRAPDGAEAEWIALRAGSLSARVLTWGATLADFRWNGRPLVLDA